MEEKQFCLIAKNLKLLKRVKIEVNIRLRKPILKINRKG
jgi:hypothetical protein